jgi:copper chaperone
MMIQFRLPALSCAHCVAAVTEACHEVDPAARVEVDLETKQVHVDTAQDRRDALVGALTEAGYPPA